VKAIVSMFTAILIAASITNAQTPLSKTGSVQGKLVKAILSESYTSEQTSAIIRDNFTWPGHEEEIDELVKTATAVDAYVITYYTLNVKGKKTIASGLVGVPSPSSGTYPVVQYHHGTQFNNQDVPSNISRSPEASLSLAIFTAHGYITSLPDFLGQGRGRPPHPYLQTGPMATATADMLKAVDELCSQLKVNTNSQLFICGLSEGGHATLSLQRRIEMDSTAQPFQLTASGPIAGPYDVNALWDFLAQINPDGSSPLVLHTYMSYKKTYGFKDRTRDIFIFPIGRQVKKIDNGTLNGKEMHAALPKTVQGLMKEQFLANVASGSHPMYQAMEGNNAYNFLPKTPIRLYHSSGDKLVPYIQSELTCARMKLLGTADVEVVNVGNYDHEASLIPALLMAKKWFDSFIETLNGSNHPQ